MIFCSKSVSNLTSGFDNPLATSQSSLETIQKAFSALFAVPYLQYASFKAEEV